MRFSFFTGALMATLASQANANFDMYISTERNPLGEQFDGWFLFNSDPSCGDVKAARMEYSHEDVSGSKLGVRCDGRGCDYNIPDQVTVLEMHFSNNPLYHWTIYKDRGHPYKMYGLDGRTYGECIMFPSNSFDCHWGEQYRGGVRMFRCLTSVTADQIRNAH